MSGASRNFLIAVFVLWCPLNLTIPVQAGYVPFWNLNEIADKAEVLAVGEVVKVDVMSRTAAERSPRKIPLRRLRATIHILRSFARSSQGASQSTPLAGHDIKIDFESLDWLRRVVLTDARAMSMPVMAVGQRLVFPLRKAVSVMESGTDESGAEGTGTDETWRLIGEDGTNLLLPATSEGLPDAQPRTPLAFLQAELAAGLVKGQYVDVQRMVVYLFGAEFQSHGPAAKKPLDAIYEDVARRIGNDEARWRDIAVASYNEVSHCTPRSSIARMREMQAGQRPCTYWPLTAQALRRMGAHSFNDLMVNGLIEHGAPTALAENYPLHPATLKFFGAGLEEGEPKVLEHVLYLLDNPARKVRSHPLVPVALAGARRFVRERRRDSRGLYAACTIIRKYGTAQDFALLTDEVRRSQRADRKLYGQLWGSMQWVSRKDSNPLVIQVCRVVIHDRNRVGGTWRYCDAATDELQRTTGNNFGMSNKASVAERDVAVARAKAWLAKNANLASAAR
jgi:hypothetical protein